MHNAEAFKDLFFLLEDCKLLSGEAYQQCQLSRTGFIRVRASHYKGYVGFASR